MDEVLRAGIAVYNAGEYHAAHDAWEDRWLDLERGSDDERLLHGLIQFTAAIYHATTGNWSGCVGLCSSAREYLGTLPGTYRGVDVDRTRRILAAFERDPERIERAPAPRLRYRGDAIGVETLSIDALAIAAETIATAYGFDRSVIRDAVRFAREEEPMGRSRFAALLAAVVSDAARRQLVYDRLCRHVDRERAKARDVSGLFE
ncbi:MAG: DUF309 domain-containing protein [Halobacteriota archaeon]